MCGTSLPMYVRLLEMCIQITIWNTNIHPFVIHNFINFNTNPYLVRSPKRRSRRNPFMEKFMVLNTNFMFFQYKNITLNGMFITCLRLTSPVWIDHATWHLVRDLQNPSFLSTKFLVFDTDCLVFDTHFLVLNANFIIFTHMVARGFVALPIDHLFIPEDSVLVETAAVFQDMPVLEAWGVSLKNHHI